jgi:hypothetical protein
LSFTLRGQLLALVEKKIENFDNHEKIVPIFDVSKQMGNVHGHVCPKSYG